MLHIHNGDATAETAKLTALPGEHFAFREALLEGPTPGNLDEAEWRTVRARHLSGGYGVELANCERELTEQETKLATFRDHEEVVLWFEHDLFCQVNLIWLLNWFSKHDPGRTKLSLICVGDFPGVADFRGLGQLTPEQLSSLFPRRTAVKPAELQLANAAWQAYASATPEPIAKLLTTDTLPLPFLDASMRAHLKRFPARRNGLGAIENTALSLVRKGKNRFIDLFPAFGDALPIYGLGDAQFWLALRRLSRSPHPLLLLENGDPISGTIEADKIRELTFQVTEDGRAVLAGKVDFVALNGIDEWLGGVHLVSPGKVWRWNEFAGQLEFRD